MFSIMLVLLALVGFASIKLYCLEMEQLDKEIERAWRDYEYAVKLENELYKK